MAGKKWAGTTFGNVWMHSRLIGMMSRIDVRAFYVFNSIFVVPFCLIFSKSARFTKEYFRIAHGKTAIGAFFWTYRNYKRFAQIVADRFAVYAGQRFDVKVEGVDLFRELSLRPEGFVMLSSHIGNYEMAGYTLQTGEKTINAVVYADEKASVNENRNRQFSRTRVNMIPLDAAGDYVFRIDKALSEGDVVSFPADRALRGGRTLSCKFFGREAEFASGPFNVIAMRSLDALAVNVMKSGPKSYTIYIKKLDYDRNAPRTEQTAQLAALYCAELERLLRMYPEQWFNFFDFFGSGKFSPDAKQHIVEAHRADKVPSPREGI